MTIGANTISVGSKAVDTIFNANISGTDGGLTKVGGDKLTLIAATSYTGATSITGGTLALTGSGAINSTTGISINSSTTGAKLNASGSAAVTKTVTLTKGTLTGSGTVNTVNVGAGTGGIISNNDGVAGAALTIGALTFNGAATVNLWSSHTSAPLVTTTLAANAAGNVIINANAASWTNGSTYDLISYDGTVGGAGIEQFDLGTVTGKATRQSATLGNTATAITLVIAGDNPVWSGANGGIWNTSATDSATSGTPNWALKNAHTTTDFWVGDIAEFNDTVNIGGTPVAPTTTTVTIQGGDVSPVSATFNNSSLDYTLTSSDGSKIAAGVLAKNGSGKLTISTANTYAGATTINGGNLTISGSGTLGSGSALTLGGGQLDLGSTSQAAGAVSITAPAASGDTILNGSLTGTSYAASNTSGNAVISASLLVNGAAGFTMSGAGGTVTLAGANTYTGTTSVTAGTLDLTGSLTGSSVSTSGTGLFNQSTSGSITGSGITFTQGSSGTSVLSGTNAYTGTTSISAGTLAAGSSTAFSNTSALSMSGTGSFDLGGYNATFTGLNGGTVNNTITNSGTGTDANTLKLITPTANFTGLITDGSSRKTAVSVGASFTPSNLNNTFSGGLNLLGVSAEGAATLKLTPISGATVVGGVVTKGAYGTGTITMGQAATDKVQFYFNASNLTLANNIVVNTNAGTDVGGAFRVESADNTISGAIQANLASVTFYHHGQFSGGPGGNASLTVTGPISSGASATGLTVQESNYTTLSGRTLTVTLSNTNVVSNSYTGNTSVTGTGATLRLGNNDQIPNGIGKGNLAVGSIFDLNGYSETVNGLSGAGTIDNVANLGAATSELTVGDNDQTSVFSGLIKNTTGTVALTKIGTGALTLSGANTFTGGLTIKNGTIVASTVNTALGGSSAGVANGLGAVTLGDTTGTSTASLLVSTTGLNYANPIVLATNATSGTLALGNSGTAISTTFSGGVTGSNDLTIISNATTGTVSLATAAINNVGKVTNTGAGSGTTTISSSIGTNVTEVIENSATSTLLLTGSNTAFAGNYSVNSGRMAIGAGFAVNSASEFNLGATTAGTSNSTLSFVNNFSITNAINVRSGNSGTKTIGLGTSADLTSTLSGEITLDDNLILDASGSTAAASLTLSGNIMDGVSGAKGLTKNGAGVLILSGTASDFSGSVAINAGELRIANAAALGDSTEITVGGSSNSAMTLTGGITAGSGKDIKIKGGGIGGFYGALATATTNTGTSEWQGSVTIDAATGTRIGSQAGTLKISGNIGETTEGSQLNVRNTGSGVTVLSGDNSYQGSTNVLIGILEVRSDGALGTTDVGTTVSSGQTLRLANNITVTGEALSITGAASGVTTPALNNLSDNNTWTGALTVGDTATFARIGSDAGKLTYSGTVALSSTATNVLVLQGNGDIEFSNVISGASNVWGSSTGTGTRTFSGANTYTGGTSINGGTLSVSSLNSVVADSSALLTSSSLGAPITDASGTIGMGSAAVTGRLLYTGTGETTNRILSLNGETGGATLDQSGTGLLKLTSNLAAPGVAAKDVRKTLTLQGSTDGTGEIEGIIADSLSGTSGQLATSLAKAGSGTWTLSGANTYTGITNIDAGILAINGDQSAANGAVTVASAATLKGTGTVGGATTIQTGGIMNAGAHSDNSPTSTAPVGKQAFSSDLALASQSIFAWDLSGEKDTATGTRGTDYDAVDIGGNLSAFTAGVTPTPASDAIFRVIVSSAFDFTTAFWDNTRTWSDIFAVTGSNTGWAAGTAVDVNTYNFATNTYTTANPTAEGSFSVSGTTLTWSAVPEPTSALVGLLIGAGLLRRRRGC